MTEPADCERCRSADQHASAYTPLEYEYLTTKTGMIIGSRDGLPIVAAVFILRSGVRHFASMSAPGLAHWNTPTFCCPWTRPVLPAILTHGPEVLTPDGVAITRKPMLDEHGHFRRLSHCPLWRHEYYVRPVFAPELPRRSV